MDPTPLGLQDAAIVVALSLAGLLFLLVPAGMLWVFIQGMRSGGIHEPDGPAPPEAP